MLGTEEFNQELDAFDHYVHHYQMKPFIGKYWNKTKKLLVIGESHYPPKNTDVKLIEDWYEIYIDDEIAEAEDKKLANELYSHTDTASCINCMKEELKPRQPYSNIDKAIRKTGFNPTESVFCYIAYSNFYQRPADK
ncbi:hypothetical protein R84B8_02570 [Treponema sp. R8-4-B8]